jgi:hypothetical protein
LSVQAFFSAPFHQRNKLAWGMQSTSNWLQVSHVTGVATNHLVSAYIDRRKKIFAVGKSEKPLSQSRILVGV